MIASAAPGRTYTALVFADPAATKVLDSLPVVGEPSFRWSFSGTEALAVTVRGTIGNAGAPGEPGSRGALANGRRVDLYAADQWSLAATDTGYGRLIYRGTIEQHTYRRAAGQVDLSVQSYQRIAATTAMTSGFGGTGPALDLARTAWQWSSSYLGWDSRNESAGGGVYVGSVPLAYTSLAGTLDNILRAAGGSWHWYVTPQGGIRLIGEDNGTATVHTLRDDANCVVTDYGLSIVSQIKRVLTVYKDAFGTVHVMNATAADWSATDPRDMWVQIPAGIDLGFYQAYLNGTLASLNREVVTGRVIVSASHYDIDSIAVGDRVNLVIPADAGNDETPGETDELVISEIANEGTTVTLGFGQPTRDLVRLIAGGQSSLEEAIRAQAYS